MLNAQIEISRRMAAEIERLNAHLETLMSLVTGLDGLNNHLDGVNNHLEKANKTAEKIAWLHYNVLQWVKELLEELKIDEESPYGRMFKAKGYM